MERLEILLVEDDPGDARLTEEALRETAVANRLSHVWDGVHALDYLRQSNAYPDAIRPDLVILDLNLPKKDGKEVLRDIKSDENLKAIPVVVFSTSTAEKDIRGAYLLHANCYVSKPVHLKEYMAAVQTMVSFWFKEVRLPPRSG
ncbi:MAG: response regulator [Terriglobales bacterium]